MQLDDACCILVSGILFLRLRRAPGKQGSRGAMADSQILLFICTGNYYRSRYAELYFNACARPALGWRAESRGFCLSANNVGPIAACASERLATRRLPAPTTPRFPLQLHPQDLARASRIIALDAAEHRRYVETLFPMWQHQIDYWQVPDADKMPVEQALRVIEREVDALLDQLTAPDLGVSAQ
jgi:low molecular weight protein-tyrosine phosphatase